MSKVLAEVLNQYLVDRKKETLAKGWGEPPEWLFYNEEGNPIDINNIRNRVFYKALEKAKLRRIRVHDLRHTYATLRIAKGDNILDVSKQLGHSSVKITLDVYATGCQGGRKLKSMNWISLPMNGSTKRKRLTVENRPHFFWSQNAPYLHPRPQKQKKRLKSLS